MPGFIARIFGGGSSPAPTPAPAPAPKAPPAKAPAPKTSSEGATKAQGASDKRRAAGQGRRRNRSVVTSPLGISPSQKTNLSKQYLTGA